MCGLSQWGCVSFNKKKIAQLFYFFFAVHIHKNSESKINRVRNCFYFSGCLLRSRTHSSQAFTSTHTHTNTHTLCAYLLHTKISHKIICLYFSGFNFVSHLVPLFVRTLFSPTKYIRFVGDANAIRNVFSHRFWTFSWICKNSASYFNFPFIFFVFVSVVIFFIAHTPHSRRRNWLSAEREETKKKKKIRMHTRPRRRRRWW